jgi:uncharacterized protein
VAGQLDEFRRGEMRVVLDANVFVSALIRPEGAPGEILVRFLRDDRFELVLSASIVDETLTAFDYPKVRKYLRASVDPRSWFESLALMALVVEPGAMAGVCRDPDDDKYFAAAIEAQADDIVSGDLDLLSVGVYEGIAVVPPRAFLDLLG